MYVLSTIWLLGDYVVHEIYTVNSRTVHVVRYIKHKQRPEELYVECLS